jgi:ATP-binding cassette subfamily C protein CydC
LLTPDCGTVVLGGERLTRPGLAASGARIGYLLQRTELFRSSIADNLLMGRPDASDGELGIAVAAVGLDRAIANLPKGLRHQLGDGGTGLSGGERRRLGSLVRLSHRQMSMCSMKRRKGLMPQRPLS